MIRQQPEPMAEVFVGIGSNVDPEANVRRALALMEERFDGLQRSGAYRNPAVGFSGDAFINLVVTFRTDAAVTEVALALAEVENACGRDRAGTKFGPRALDLDLLMYGDLVCGDGPVLPREEILERAFVLGPLAELAPDLVHPTEHRRLAELWAAFPGDRGTLELVEL
jgi:2-amino-4-hydroxy-6-hydroxymethyldihydropteridine diphosphokinase